MNLIKLIKHKMNNKQHLKISVIIFKIYKDLENKIYNMKLI